MFYLFFTIDNGTEEKPIEYSAFPTSVMLTMPVRFVHVNHISVICVYIGFILHILLYFIMLNSKLSFYPENRCSNT